MRRLVTAQPSASRVGAWCGSKKAVVRRGDHHHVQGRRRQQAAENDNRHRSLNFASRLAHAKRDGPLVCKEAGIVEQTFYRWRREYGGLQLEQAKKLKDLQKENAQLKRALATLTLEKQVLKDIAEGNF